MVAFSSAKKWRRGFTFPLDWLKAQKISKKRAESQPSSARFCWATVENRVHYCHSRRIL